jgi:tRNA 2-thiocytidine biosynthesis protein TtcA
MSRRLSSTEKVAERFSHHVGRGINRFDMVREGDRILIGVSGGKDSLALSLALSARKKWVPVDYDLFALQIDWREYPMEEEEKRRIDEFYASLGIPLARVPASINPGSFKKKFSCYTCSRNRKRILFDHAARIGATKIALGHHQDDIARTTLMNLFFRSEFSTMMPVQRFFGGRLSIIRPLCEVREAEVLRVASRLALPTVPSRCPNAETNQRALMARILKEVSRVDRHAVSNVYGSAWRINTEYLPGSPAAGEDQVDEDTDGEPGAASAHLESGAFRE